MADYALTNPPYGLKSAPKYLICRKPVCDQLGKSMLDVGIPLS